MENEHNKIKVIYLLRGIAALLVCIYHLVATVPQYITNGFLLEYYHQASRGVQIFFIISGVVIPLSMIKVNYTLKYFFKYLLRRFIRLEPPYILAVLLSTFIIFIQGFLPLSPVDFSTISIKDIFLQIGYLVPFFEDSNWINPVFWTLSIEFQYYLFMTITFSLALSKKKFLVWTFNLLILVLPFSFPKIAFFTYWSAYFGLGIFYVLYAKGKYSFSEFFVLLILCSFSILLHQGFIDLIIGICTLLVIHFFKDVNNKIGHFLGRISYSIYLLHTIVGTSFIGFIMSRYHKVFNVYLVIFIGLIITVITSYVFWLLIENPSHKKARQINLK